MKKGIVILLSIIAIGCSSAIQSNFTTQNKPLTIEEKVAFLDLQNAIPENAKKLGSAKFGDSGFSTNCDFNAILISARKLARTNGANIVKVTKKTTPDLWSSCYRITADFYFYDGDVSKLPQYQLQIN